MRIWLAIAASLLASSCQAGCAYRMEMTRSEAGVAITGHGTATAISKGILLTAAHNTAGYSELRLLVEDGVARRWATAKVMRSRKDIDVAILSCPEVAESMDLAASNPRVGQEITLTGSKRGSPISSHEGVVERAWHNGNAQYLAKLRSSANRPGFDHGDSGAPIVSNNLIVGMAVAGIPKDGDLDTSRALFIPAVVLRQFLDDASGDDKGGK